MMRVLLKEQDTGILHVVAVNYARYEGVLDISDSADACVGMYLECYDGASLLVKMSRERCDELVSTLAICGFVDLCDYEFGGEE